MKTIQTTGGDPVRAALAELVALKDMKDRLEQLHMMGHGTDYTDYRRRQPLAWATARAALSRPAAPAEPVAQTYCINCDSPMPEGCRGTFKGDGQCALENPAKVTSEPPMSPDGEGPLYDDPYFGVQDEVYLTRAVSVMNDVLTDISGWEDQALAEAIKSSKVDLCAMIECIRMRADSSYVPGSKPIDGEVAAPVSADAQKAQSEHSQRGPEDADFPWPKLLKPAHVCGTTFGVGVSSRLVVECAMRHADYKVQETPKTTEQRQQDEANRRSLWDMIHGPVDPANPLGEILAEQAKRTVYSGRASKTASSNDAQKAVARGPLTEDDAVRLAGRHIDAPHVPAYGFTKNAMRQFIRELADKWGIRLSGSTEGESNHG